MRRVAVLLTLLAVAVAVAGVGAAPADAARKKPRAKPTCVAAKAKGKRPAAKAAARRPTKARCRRRAKRRPTAKAPAAAVPQARPAQPAPSGPAAPAAPPAPAPAPAEPSGPVWSTLGVAAYDIDEVFVLRLTKTEVPAGMLTVYFRNHDSSLHNLWMSSPAGETTQVSDDAPRDTGATKTLAVTPGAWTLFCSLPGHGSMTRSLAVR